MAFAMDGVYRLHFGESNVPTPTYIRDALRRALDEGYTFYTENAGLPGLREAIAEKVRALHGVELDAASEITVTASGVQALNVAIRCVIDPGDEAIVLTPNWPNASAIVTMFGGVARELPFVLTGDRYAIDFDAMGASVGERTRLLVCTSPSNPLGWVATTEEQRRLLDFCREHRLWLLADEVYERIYYEATVAPSILRLCDRSDAVIVTQSFSKSYCMTGWRLGWLVARSDLAVKAAQLNEFIVSHAAAMIQRAGEVAIRHDDREIEEMVGLLRERIGYCYQRLKREPALTVGRPQGAFYLFPRIDGVADSLGFAKALLRREQVAVAPGSAFGNGGEGAVRICCAADMDILEPALERFCRFVADREGRAEVLPEGPKE
jgi:aspartate/methionine/tyrosine aminotransferase